MKHVNIISKQQQPVRAQSLLEKLAFYGVASEAAEALSLWRGLLFPWLGKDGE
jgi:hypothetical protein